MGSAAENFCRCPWLLQEFPAQLASPKAALKQIMNLRRAFNGVPANWAPTIVSISPSCLQVNPRQCANSSSPLEAGVEDTMLEDRTAPQLIPPTLACVPLALGTNFGTCLGVGVRIASQSPSQNSEGCLLSVEMVGLVDGFGMVWSLAFAPFSGRCLMTYKEEELVMVSQAMPSIEESNYNEVYAFVQVTESGGICFCRSFGSGGSVQKSGCIPAEAFPSWVAHYFVGVIFQVDQLLAQTEVSVVWAADELPSRCTTSDDFDAVWSVQERD